MRTCAMRTCSMLRIGSYDPAAAVRRCMGPRALFVLAAGLLVLVAMPVRADWKDDYARGLEAVQGGQWADASRYMQAALEDNDKPAKRVRLYGQRWEMYAPQHYAGLAAYKQGDCATAQRLWSSAANRSFTAGMSDLAAVEAQANKDCDVRLASQAKPASEPVASVPPRSEPAAEPKPAPPKAEPPPKAKPEPPAQAPAKVARAPSAADQLRSRVEAYLSRNYNTVMHQTERSAAQGKLGAQMQLLRAAAAYREAALAGDEGKDALATARAAARAARQSGPSLQPDATFF